MTDTPISNNDTTVLFLVEHFTKGFLMGDKEWDAITKIRSDVDFMKGRMSILVPVFVVSCGSLIVSLISLIIALYAKAGG